jgi:uncharacterized membrane protein
MDMLNWLKVGAGATLLSATLSGQAMADVEVCNKTSVGMDFAIASWVAKPEETNQVQGWYSVDSDACRKLWTGDYSGTSVYIYASFHDGVEWREENEYALVCVRSDGEKFDRRGTWPELQSCPSGWDARRFYESKVTAPEQRINYQGR